jgi:hypothetical protein
MNLGSTMGSAHTSADSDPMNPSLKHYALTTAKRENEPGRARRRRRLLGR